MRGLRNFFIFGDAVGSPIISYIQLSCTGIFVVSVMNLVHNVHRLQSVNRQFNTVIIRMGVEVD